MVDAAFHHSDADGWLSQWKRTWAQVACGAGLAIGLFLLWRRFDGGLHQPLSAQSLLALAVVLITAAVCIRKLWHVGDGSEIGRRVLPALMLIAVGLSVSLPSSNGAALMAFWLLLILTEAISLFLRNGIRPDDGATQSHGRQTVEDPEAEANTSAIAASSQAPRLIQPALDNDAISTIAETPLGQVAETDAPEVDGQVIQKLLRTRDPSGQEVLFGELRAEFAAGERQSRLHVAFCPPLDRPPKVYAEATDVDDRLGDVTVKVAQVLTLGTRIDVELSAPATVSGAVQVEFYAAVES